MKSTIALLFLTGLVVLECSASGPGAGGPPADPLPKIELAEMTSLKDGDVLRVSFTTRNVPVGSIINVDINNVNQTGALLQQPYVGTVVVTELNQSFVLPAYQLKGPGVLVARAHWNTGTGNVVYGDIKTAIIAGP